MRILILNWRDIKNPRAGGAEVYLHEIGKRWARQGHEVIQFSPLFANALPEENIEGIKIVRGGNTFTVYWEAYRFYKKHDSGHFDCVIDSINTIPFFTPWYVEVNRISLIYQLAREVWFHEAPFPVNILGFLLEPLYMRLYRKNRSITISESSKQDLIKLGYRKDIPILSPGILVAPLGHLPEKETDPTLIYVGRVRKSKRVHHILSAFHQVQRRFPSARLWIVGSGDQKYIESLTGYIEKNNVKEVTFWGFLSEEKKLELMRKAHIILVASVREGWGIIVTEAAAMGTPAIVYNVPGLKDSVQHEKTGRIVQKNSPENLAQETVRLLEKPEEWKRLAQSALESAKNYNWDEIAARFLRFMETNP